MPIMHQFLAVICNVFIIYSSVAVNSKNVIQQSRSSSSGALHASESISSIAKRQNTFECPQQFGYYRDASDCSKYYICSFGIPLPKKCTAGLHFSVTLQNCDWPINVLCNDNNDDTDFFAFTLVDDDDYTDLLGSNWGKHSQKSVETKPIIATTRKPRNGVQNKAKIIEKTADKPRIVETIRNTNREKKPNDYYAYEKPNATDYKIAAIPPDYYGIDIESSSDEPIVVNVDGFDVPFDRRKQHKIPTPTAKVKPTIATTVKPRATVPQFFSTETERVSYSPTYAPTVTTTTAPTVTSYGYITRPVHYDDSIDDFLSNTNINYNNNNRRKTKNNDISNNNNNSEGNTNKRKTSIVNNRSLTTTTTTTTSTTTTTTTTTSTTRKPQTTTKRDKKPLTRNNSYASKIDAFIPYNDSSFKFRSFEQPLNGSDNLFIYVKPLKDGDRIVERLKKLRNAHQISNVKLQTNRYTVADDINSQRTQNRIRYEKLVNNEKSNEDYNNFNNRDDNTFLKANVSSDLSNSSYNITPDTTTATPTTTQTPSLLTYQKQSLRQHDYFNQYKAREAQRIRAPNQSINKLNPKIIANNNTRRKLIADAVTDENQIRNSLRGKETNNRNLIASSDNTNGNNNINRNRDKNDDSIDLLAKYNSNVAIRRQLANAIGKFSLKAQPIISYNTGNQNNDDSRVKLEFATFNVPKEVPEYTALPKYVDSLLENAPKTYESKLERDDTVVALDESRPENKESIDSINTDYNDNNTRTNDIPLLPQEKYDTRSSFIQNDSNNNKNSDEMFRENRREDSYIDFLGFANTPKTNFHLIRTRLKKLNKSRLLSMSTDVTSTTTKKPAIQPIRYIITNHSAFKANKYQTEEAVIPVSVEEHTSDEYKPKKSDYRPSKPNKTMQMRGGFMANRRKPPTTTTTIPTTTTTPAATTTSATTEAITYSITMVTTTETPDTTFVTTTMPPQTTESKPNEFKPFFSQKLYNEIAKLRQPKISSPLILSIDDSETGDQTDLNNERNESHKSSDDSNRESRQDIKPFKSFDRYLSSDLNNNIGDRFEIRKTIATDTTETDITQTDTITTTTTQTPNMYRSNVSFTVPKLSTQKLFNPKSTRKPITYRINHTAISKATSYANTATTLMTTTTSKPTSNVMNIERETTDYAKHSTEELLATTLTTKKRFTTSKPRTYPKQLFYEDYYDYGIALKAIDDRSEREPQRNGKEKVVTQPTTTTAAETTTATTKSVQTEPSVYYRKSRPTNRRIKVKDATREPPKPASRPVPVFPTTKPLVTAAKCDPKKCKLPDCRCGGSDIPGGHGPKNIPQIVMITFDDAVNDLNWEIYEDIFGDRFNPNGCPIRGTFYVSHEWTDYGQVQTLYSRGHEMASHGVTHSFGEKFSVKEWIAEINGQREILHLYGGVKFEDVRGMRAPFLQTGGNRMFEMLYETNFTYDSSLPVPESTPPFFPYTLHYALNHQCMIPPCPTKSFPGVWEVGMIMWHDMRGGRCSMGDACTNPNDEEGVYEMLLKNFNRHYKSNRAPFGLYYHSAWFNTQHYRKGFLRFLDEIILKDDVYFLTNWQMLQWMRNPTPLDQIMEFEPWKCDSSSNSNSMVACNHPSICNVNSKNGARQLRTCQPCPNTYPWLGNTGFSHLKFS